MKYNKQSIIHQYENGAPMSFVFFWSGVKSFGPIGSSCLSQWYPCRFTEDGVTYTTAEQYMMARKARLFNDEETYLKIMSATHPSDCKKLGRLVRNFSPRLWDSNKYNIVLNGSLLKFSQNSACRDFLLKTGNAVLAEASPYDQIWGVGLAQEDERIRNPKSWRGENLLGFALMEARDILAQKQ